MKEVLYYMKPKNLILYLMGKGHLQFLSDQTFIKIKYRLSLGKKLNLKNPQTFNEKLQWLKLNDRKPEYTNMVDKYAVKEYIKERSAFISVKIV